MVVHECLNVLDRHNFVVYYSTRSFYDRYPCLVEPTFFGIFCVLISVGDWWFDPFRRTFPRHRGSLVVCVSWFHCPFGCCFVFRDIRVPFRNGDVSPLGFPIVCI